MTRTLAHDVIQSHVSIFRVTHGNAKLDYSAFTPGVRAVCTFRPAKQVCAPEEMHFQSERGPMVGLNSPHYNILLSLSLLCLWLSISPWDFIPSRSLSRVFRDISSSPGPVRDAFLFVHTQK